MTDERPPRPKAATAFRTIGEVATELGVPQHVLRYWEGRFPQLKPLQRAGNRRLYRPADIDLVRRIHALLNTEGYSIRGVQKLLTDGVPVPVPAALAIEPVIADRTDLHIRELRDIRQVLADALKQDDISG
ncbi:MerR family transcriptional regulator [Sphingomonas montana]|uniref:MerR family transcriptional regulator n=1 Tax=Sphingomonas montana TaxID=1843236 RepID=UPI00096E2E08|nr:MerR family transcriptional regulator [Sphingomonas montana]